MENANSKKFDKLIEDIWSELYKSNSKNKVFKSDIDNKFRQL